MNFSYSERYLNAQADERLVELARDGNSLAFGAIAERYRSELLRTARRLGSPGRAEDVVQQTFLNAFAALQAGSQVVHLRGWLHQILRNTAARLAIPESADRELDREALATDSVEDVFARRALARQTLSELVRLPDRQRDALISTALHGQSRTVVAQRLGVSEGSVRQLVHRARTSIRTAVAGVIPLPVSRWFSPAGRSWMANSGPDAVAAGGALAGGGATVKLGALLAAGLVAAGVASQPARHAFRPPHRSAHHRLTGPGARRAGPASAVLAALGTAGRPTAGLGHGSAHGPGGGIQRAGRAQLRLKAVRVTGSPSRSPAGIPDGASSSTASTGAAASTAGNSGGSDHSPGSSASSGSPDGSSVAPGSGSDGRGSGSGDPGSTPGSSGPSSDGSGSGGAGSGSGSDGSGSSSGNGSPGGPSGSPGGSAGQTTGGPGPTAPETSGGGGSGSNGGSGPDGPIAGGSDSSSSGSSGSGSGSDHGATSATAGGSSASTGPSAAAGSASSGSSGATGGHSSGG